MKNNIFIWGSKSYALIINEFIKNYKNEINIIHSNIIRREQLKIKYFFDPYAKNIHFNHGAIFFNKLSQLLKNLKNCNSFIVCIGNNHGKTRLLIGQLLQKKGLKPLTLVSKNSIISKNSSIGKGVIIMPNSYVGTFSKIGDYCILNSSCNIEHETSIGTGTHVMSGACISGRNKIGNFVTIGANATILPDIKIADGAYIGAGSVVTRNVKQNEIIVGNPGKYLKKNKHIMDSNFIAKLKKIL
jgi:acetyltransferase EpsM